MLESPDSRRAKAFFLTPEPPRAEFGGGSMRSASLLEYLRAKYDVDVAALVPPPHSKAPIARAGRNAVRWVRGRPPLYDRYAGLEPQIKPAERYRVAVVEHIWCAPYAERLRPHADVLVLDLHNVESALARSHARAVCEIEALAWRRFGASYERLEREWLPRFDMILTASEEDRERIAGRLREARGRAPRIAVYPNALPEGDPPRGVEENAVVFSGNLEYHPNIAAVRWFYKYVWPELREQAPDLEWRLVGRNPEAVRRIVSRDDPRIRITGPVDDALAEIVKAKVCIVPLISGSGTRFKILEAWAARRPVISTSIGAEGLGARSGTHLLIADDAEAFRDAILTALSSEETRRKLGACGRCLYEARYTWPKAWAALETAGL